MGFPDILLFTLLAVADAYVLIHLHRRRVRRLVSERMQHSLRAAIRRETGDDRVVAVRPRWFPALQRAS